MKRFLGLFSAVVVGACTLEPNYQALEQTESSEFTQANHAAVDKLVASTAVPIDKKLPILIATVVNIDALDQSSRFGRLISEQIATRLTQGGFNVVEMKLRNDVYIREGTGELLLSRDVRDLSKNYNAQMVVVGNYAIAASHAFLTLKAVTVTDNRVIGAVNYQLPMTRNAQALIETPFKGRAH